MAAGGNHYLMFMQQSNSDQIWGTSLCDYKSVQNDYLCKPCLPGYFSAGFTKLRCLPCDTISDFYSQLNQFETNRLLFICGETANQGRKKIISKLGLGIGLSIGASIIIFVVCIFLIRRRRRQRDAARAYHHENRRQFPDAIIAVNQRGEVEVNTNRQLINGDIIIPHLIAQNERMSIAQLRILNML